MARTSKRLWGFDDEGREFVLEMTEGIPELRAMVARAQRQAGEGGMWLVKATVDELDQMYDLAQAMMDATRSRRRLDMLEGMLASLCTSMDGF